MRRPEASDARFGCVGVSIVCARGAQSRLAAPGVSMRRASESASRRYRHAERRSDTQPFARAGAGGGDSGPRSRLTGAPPCRATSRECEHLTARRTLACPRRARPPLISGTPPCRRGPRPSLAGRPLGPTTGARVASRDRDTRRAHRGGVCELGEGPGAATQPRGIRVEVGCVRVHAHIQVTETTRSRPREKPSCLILRWNDAGSDRPRTSSARPRSRDSRQRDTLRRTNGLRITRGTRTYALAPAFRACHRRR